MKRDFLRDLGVEGDAIEQIMAQNGKDIEDAKKGIDDLKQQIAAKDTEISGLKEQIAQRDTDIEALRTASADNESLKTQLSELQPIFTKNINNPAPAPSSGGNPFVGGWNFQQVRNFDKSKE